MQLFGASVVLKSMLAVTQSQKTYTAEQVPLLYREPGVLTGYRPQGKCFTYYLKSAFQINNETVNIWTHALTFCVVLIRLMSFHEQFAAGDPRYWPILVFCLCCLMYSALSVLAHTIHSISPTIHYVCFQIDYMGIGHYSLGSNILFIYCSIPHDVIHVDYTHWLLPAYVCMSWMSFFSSCIAKLKYSRPYPFRRKLWQIVPYSIITLVDLILLYPRVWQCYTSPECQWTRDEPGLALLGLYFIATLLSLVTFSSHFPERRWPGRFDIIGQGHQMFHVATLLMTILQIEAGVQDILHYKRERQVYVYLGILLGCMLLLLSMCIFTVICLLPVTRSRVEWDSMQEGKRQ